MSKIVILRCLSRLSLQLSTFRTSLISAQAATQSLEGFYVKKKDSKEHNLNRKEGVYHYQQELSSV